MIERSLALVTALVPKIGYDEAARIARKAYDSRKTIREVMQEEGLISINELNLLLDPRSMTEPMKSLRKKK